MAFVAKEVFDNLVEEFRGLQVQVMDQDKTIKKLTDGLTLSEGALKEKLETRLTDAVHEMNLRVEEVKIEIKKMEEKSEQLLEATVPGIIQTHMNDAKSQCRQFISENNKSLADRLEESTSSRKPSRSSRTPSRRPRSTSSRSRTSRTSRTR